MYTHQPQASTPNKNTIEKCAICEKPTDKCCSLCRKVFYCNSEHQEVDWHMRHKFNCEGRLEDPPKKETQSSQPYPSNYATNEENQFLIYSRNLKAQE